jgi:hypothetical protein
MHNFIKTNLKYPKSQHFSSHPFLICMLTKLYFSQKNKNMLTISEKLGQKLLGINFLSRLVTKKHNISKYMGCGIMPLKPLLLNYILLYFIVFFCR